MVLYQIPSIHIHFEIRTLPVSHSMGLTAPDYIRHWLSMRLCLVGQCQTGHISHTLCITLVSVFHNNNNGPNWHLFYVGGDLMMRRHAAYYYASRLGLAYCVALIWPPPRAAKPPVPGRQSRPGWACLGNMRAVIQKWENHFGAKSEALGSV